MAHRNRGFSHETVVILDLSIAFSMFLPAEIPRHPLRPVYAIPVLKPFETYGDDWTFCILRKPPMNHHLQTQKKVYPLVKNNSLLLKPWPIEIVDFPMKPW